MARRRFTLHFPHFYKYLVIVLLAVIVGSVALTYVTVYSQRSKASVKDLETLGLEEEMNDLDNQQIVVDGSLGVEQETLKTLDAVAEAQSGSTFNPTTIPNIPQGAGVGAGFVPGGGLPGAGLPGQSFPGGNIPGQGAQGGNGQVGCLAAADPDAACSNFPCQNNDPYCSDTGNCKCRS